MKPTGWDKPKRHSCHIAVHHDSLFARPAKLLKEAEAASEQTLETESRNWIPRLKATSRFIFSQRKLSLAADKSISVPPTFAIGPKWGKRLELWTEFSTSLGR